MIVLFWIRIILILHSWQEITFDAIRITNTDLNVILFFDASTRIQFISFNKYSSHCIKRLNLCYFINLVLIFNDCTIKMTE